MPACTHIINIRKVKNRSFAKLFDATYPVHICIICKTSELNADSTSIVLTTIPKTSINHTDAAEEPEPIQRPVRRANAMPAGPTPIYRSWAQRLSMKSLGQEIDAIELDGRRSRSLSGEHMLDADSFERLYRSENWDWPLTETRHQKGMELKA
jgi:hypothetical protein